MVDVAKAAKCVAKLTALKFFPSDPKGQTAVVEIACSMATETEQVEWLVGQMLALYNEWPGPREMRALFCQRWKPASGPDVIGSSVFHGGEFPDLVSTQQGQIEGPPRISKRLMA